MSNNSGGGGGQCHEETATIEVINDGNCSDNKGHIITINGDSRLMLSANTSATGSTAGGLDRITATTVAAVKNLLVATKDERAARGKYTRFVLAASTRMGARSKCTR